MASNKQVSPDFFLIHYFFGLWDFEKILIQYFSKNINVLLWNLLRKIQHKVITKIINILFKKNPK